MSWLTCAGTTYLVNLLQTMVETLLFYHPAVWWLSRRVRIEREHCCDDLAAAVCGSRIEYAAAAGGRGAGPLGADFGHGRRGKPSGRPDASARSPPVGRVGR